MVDVFADVPEAYTRNNIHPELREKLELVGNKVLSLLNSNATLIEGDNKFVELSVMKKNNKHLLVHLVNYNVTVDGDITPAKNIEVQVAIPKGLSVKNITYNGELKEMQNLKYDIQKQEGFSLATFTLPNLNIYGLAKIELDQE